MAWPTNTELQAIDKDILTYGIADLSDELASGKRDVIAMLKAKWWTVAAGSNTLKRSGYPAIMDEDKLNSDELQKLVMYRALAVHIYPQFSKKLGADGDSFARRSIHYSNRFDNEWDIIIDLDIYDFTNDDQFTDYDRVEGTNQRRVFRA